ncbi:MAG: fibronectin type III domain-containing protein [Acidobacteriota bacterium]
MNASALKIFVGALVVCAGTAVAGPTFEVIGVSTDEAKTSTVAPTLVPAGPTFLQAQAVSSSRVALLWQDNSSNETFYSIEVGVSGSPTFVASDPLPANSTAAFIGALDPGVQYQFRLRAINASGGSTYSNIVTATTLSSDSPCDTTPTAMCLENSEFRVQAMFQAPGGDRGEAHAVKLTNDSGYLWFFSSEAVEAVVKVLDACGVNSRFWVFAGGLTNVRVLLIVTDTVADQSKGYVNPIDVAFKPVQDTNAFDTCVR